ncbi:HAMP domain-containing histidine kinase [Candidatus Sulfurimonas marisnigri]|uniref:histidine kinase n=1 Tax=Candidatus Sulfurimonas marisnigri TaxID=2740405 RepID=A0A7S7LYL9_9BACT|nr:HAMP domain-containing sensor histidine kinase [Candidatus Sulfurimonas marisnigri]QOY53859.1 HAMP domain-containing histidine kinase [Candidatus Sulfurimonas marisnigri]
MDIRSVCNIGIKKPDIPKELFKKWLEMVDSLTCVADVSYSLVVRAVSEKIEVVCTSKIDASKSLESELYSESVIREKSALYIENSLKDECCNSNNSDLTQIVGYYGEPLLWSDNSVFGAICIVDNKELILTDISKQLLGIFRGSIENSLRILELTHVDAVENHQSYNDKNKSIFISSMSHELRTPLNSIIGFTGLILNDIVGPISDLQRDYIQRVEKSGKHLLLLTTDIVEVLKIEVGVIIIKYEPFNLNVLAGEVVKIMEEEAHKKGLQLAVNIPNNIELYSDRIHLKQCLFNLISNAVKYSESGVINVTSECDEKLVKISISDNGIGISQNNLIRLYQPFERLESQLKEKVAGTGLGLYITQKLTREVLGGDVSCISKIDEGSTFTLNIPQHVENIHDIQNISKVSR